MSKGNLPDFASDSALISCFDFIFGFSGNLKPSNFGSSGNFSPFLI